MTSLLTTTQAAERLGLRAVTLEAWRVRGGGPKFIKLGRAVRYDLDDLDDFIGARKLSTTSDCSNERTA